jgi:hypothetical protein
MYDLILCVLATTKNNRLEIFNKIGYKNTKKYNYKIIYLVDYEQKPDFITNDWYQQNCKYSVRFVDYLKNTKEQFRWIMQVDDDSCTDIEKTIDLLDKNYDYNDCVHLTGSSEYYLKIPSYPDQNFTIQHLSSHYLEPVLQQVLKEMRLNETDDYNKFDTIPFICNGWENSVYSKKSVEKIQKYERLEEFVRVCEKNQPNFSDQVPFLLSKVSKIPISSCFFFSPVPSVSEYSVINISGRFSHIHHIFDSSDLLLFLVSNIQKQFLDKYEIEKDLDDFLHNSNWFFYHIEDNTVISRCGITLAQNKNVEILPLPWNMNINFESQNFNLKK